MDWLYPDNDDADAFAQRFNKIVLSLAEGAKRYLIEPPLMDDSRMRYLAYRLRQSKKQFPYVGGFASASPFKKAAEYAVHVVEVAPLTDLRFQLPLSAKYTRYQNWPSIWIALHLAQLSLHGAKIKWKDGTIKELTERIEWSDHTLEDLYEMFNAFSDVYPQEFGVEQPPFQARIHQQRYQFMALFLEQSVYRTNDAMYPIATGLPLVGTT